MTYDQHVASLIAAQSGDDRAFAELTGRYAVELHTHCYRMLGSVHDADEALQDVWFRAWRGLGGFTGRGTVRGWLYRIATNVCLTMIEQRGRRMLPIDLSSPPVTETAWLEPYPDTVPLLLDNRSDPHERAERRAPDTGLRRRAPAPARQRTRGAAAPARSWAIRPLRSPT